MEYSRDMFARYYLTFDAIVQKEKERKEKKPSEPSESNPKKRRPRPPKSASGDLTASTSQAKGMYDFYLLLMLSLPDVSRTGYFGGCCWVSGCTVCRSRLATRQGRRAGRTERTRGRQRECARERCSGRAYT